MKIAEWNPMRQRCACVETEITDEERLMIDELKALIINNETEEYLPFKKVDQRKFRDITNRPFQEIFNAHVAKCTRKYC